MVGSLDRGAELLSMCLPVAIRQRSLPPRLIARTIHANHITQEGRCAHTHTVIHNVALKVFKERPRCSYEL